MQGDAGIIKPLRPGKPEIIADFLILATSWQPSTAQKLNWVADDGATAERQGRKKVVGCAGNRG
jgi:hypothetical protein